MSGFRMNPAFNCHYLYVNKFKLIKYVVDNSLMLLKKKYGIPPSTSAMPAVLRLAARPPAHRPLRPGHRDRGERRLTGRSAGIRRHRRPGPALDGAHLPRARPCVPSRPGWPTRRASPGWAARRPCCMATYRQGFGLRLDPPRDVCRRVLARIFPQAHAELSESDPWTALLRALRLYRLPRPPPAPKLAPHPPP